MEAGSGRRTRPKIMSQPTIDEACSLLLLNDDAAFTAATELLFKILQNIHREPEEAKYRSINRGGASFSKAVGSAKGGVRMLKAVGFVEEGSAEGATSLVLASPDLALIEQGKNALKQCVKLNVARREEARRKENEAAAEKLAALKEVSKRNTANRDQAQEAEKQRLKAGIKQDHEENALWKAEEDARKASQPTPIK